MQVRTRFAPSPTGYMHIGNLRSALYTYLFAKKNGGKFILRIEDTDQEREVEGAVELIYSTLKKVGLNYDEGPDVGGDYGPYIQSQRRGIYKGYAEELVKKGAAYYCFCTAEELEAAHKAAQAKGETYKYDKHCLHLSPEEVEKKLKSGAPYVIRFNAPTEGETSFTDAVYGEITVENATLDDIVLLKSDGLPTYNFANVVDDHLMGITHVLRGNEYLSSTPKYNLIYDAFGWEKPAYVHLPPVMKDEKRKLSKRHGDPSFEDLLAEGFLKDAIVNYIALLGWNPGTNQEMFSLAELEQAFDWTGLSKSPAIFDMAKLTWFNAEYMRRLPPEEYAALARPWLLKVLDPEKFDFDYLYPLLQGRTEVLRDIPGMVDFLNELPDYDNALYVHKKMKTTVESAHEVLKELMPLLMAVEPWNEDTVQQACKALVERTGRKNGQVLWPLRIALSGKMATPCGAYELCVLLGKEESLRRIAAGIGQTGEQAE